MKRLIGIMLGTVLALFIFAITLEGIGYAFLKMGFRPSFNPPTVTNKISPRENQIRSWVSEWLALNKKRLNPQEYIDQKLRNEPALYTDLGILNKKSLWGENQHLAANIDDEFRLVGQNSGKEKWRVRYRTDKYGHRITHHERKPEAKRNILFLGCSFTFGEGVPDEQVFPAKVADHLPGTQTYNFGIQGSSPARILKSLREMGPGYLEAIDEKSGAAVLTFIDDHVRRIVGSSERLIQHSSILTSDPRFFLTGGELNYQPSFAEDSFGRYRAYRFLGTTNFARAFNLEFPFIGEDHFLLVSKVIGGIRDEIKKHRPDIRFYFAFYPSEKFYRDRLIPYLLKENIEILDYSDISFLNVLGNQSDLGTDRHPSAIAHDLYAYLLAKDLKEKLP